MAHKTPIARWVLDNRTRVNASFEQLDWPNRHFAGVYDFSVDISVDGIAASGRGIDADKDLALEKAAAEAIERYICLRLGMDSIGFAVSGHGGSAKHAYAEALERHFFNEHIRTKLPFLPLNSSEEVDTFKLLRSRFEQSAFEHASVAFFKMAAPRPHLAFVAMISLKGTPRFLGLALGENPDKVSQRAFLEAMSNYACYLEAPGSFQLEVEGNPDFWTCKPSFLVSISQLFADTDQEIKPFASPPLAEATIDLSDMSVLRSCPISPIKYKVMGGRT